MTLVAAWVRSTPGGEELVLASDSRVTGGLALSHAPKLFMLERGDAALAYCGPTVLAYPLLLQIKASLDAPAESRRRATDICELKSHIEKSIASLRARIEDMPKGDSSHRKFKFLLGGYSWRYSKFRVWVFKYDIESGEFNAFSFRNSGRFVFMSDQEENEIRATHDLLKMRRVTGGRRWDWEPLRVLIHTIEHARIREIGGPPQVMKVYRHGSTLPYNVLWPELQFDEDLGLVLPKHQITHLGRPILDHEKTPYLTLDPKSWDLVEPWNVRARQTLRNNEEHVRAKHNARAKLARTIGSLAAKRLLQAQLSEAVAAGIPFTRPNVLSVLS